MNTTATDTGVAEKAVTEYPLTAGKKLALEYFHWHLVAPADKWMVAPSLLRLAALIDDKINPACALLKKAP